MFSIINLYCQEFILINALFLILIVNKYMQNCPFCTDLDLIQCMHTSLFFKHNEEIDRNLAVIEKIVENKRSSTLLRFEQISNIVDKYQNMASFYEGQQLKAQKEDMLQYYKYRKFIPMFGCTKQADTIHNYYYERFKIYYNQVKRKLNITVQNTQQSSQNSSSYDHTQNDFQNSQFELIKMRSKILKDLTTDIPIDTGDEPQDIRAYKTQSKALQDLVYLLKANQKFRYVQPLKFDSSNKFKSSKQLFKDTVVSRAKQFADYRQKKNKKIFITFGEGSKKCLNIDLKEQSAVKSSKKISYETIMTSKNQKNFYKDKDKNFLKKTTIMQITSTNNRKSLQRSKNIQVLKKLSKIKEQILANKISEVYLHPESSKKLRKSKIFTKTPSKQKQLKQAGSSKQQIQSKRQYPNISNKNNNIKFEQSPSPYYQKLGKTRQLQKLHSKDGNYIKKYHSQKKIKTQKNFQTLRINQPCGKQIKLKLKHKNDQGQQQDASKNIKRRKSVDLTKIKGPQEKDKHFQDFVKQSLKNINFQHRQTDSLTSPLSNIYTIDLLSSKFGIRTAPTSPKKTSAVFNKDFKIQKSDNIISINKKKLDMLKQKAQGFKNRNI